MPKKILLLLAVLPLLLTGCQSARRIETAAVIENVCVQKSGGQLCYTFYRLTDSEKPDSVAVPASSFEEARRLAESSYIPHMTLAKLELLLIEQSVSREVMENDVAYIATQASFSPTAHVALCDEKTLQRLRRDTGAQKQIEQQIDLLCAENPQVKSDYLSVFNSFARKKPFQVPLIIQCRSRAATVSPRVRGWWDWQCMYPAS